MTEPVNSTGSRDATVDEEPPAPEVRPSVEEVAHRLTDLAKELWDYVEYYLQTKKDLARVTFNKVLGVLVLGAVGAIVASAMLLVAGVYVVRGMAGGFAQLFGSAWLGTLTAGLLTIAFLGGGLFFLLHRQKSRNSARLRQNYEQRRLEQLAKYGRDVTSA